MGVGDRVREGSEDLPMARSFGNGLGCPSPESGLRTIPHVESSLFRKGDSKDRAAKGEFQAIKGVWT